MNLAAIPSPTTAVWHFGPLPLRAYALLIALGIVVACVVTERRMRRRGAPAGFVLDVAIWAVPLGIVGARVYSLATSPQEYFGSGHDPWEWIKIWHGGLGIWGGVAGGALGAWICCRLRGIPLTFVADALAPGLALAQAIGRWGNWFNNELYGKPTGLPWGLRVHVMDPDDPGHALMVDGRAVNQPGLGQTDVLYQPTFLYESLWDVGVAVLVWLLDRRFRFGRGRAFALYVMAYTAGRFWVEYLRVDEANHFLGLRLNDWTSIVVFLAALAYFTLVRGPRVGVAADGQGRMRVVPAGAAVDTGADPADPAAGSTGSHDAAGTDPDRADPGRDGPDVPAAGTPAAGPAGAGAVPTRSADR